MRKVILALLIFLATAIIVPVAFGLLGLWLDAWLVNPLSSLKPALITPGVILLISGFGIVTGSSLQLRLMGKGLPISPLPPTELVTSGLYKLCRHPIYLGASIAFFGAGLFLGSLWMLVLSWPLFTLFFSCYALIVEEPVLIARYGESYRKYSIKTPLVFPVPGIKRLDAILESIIRRLRPADNGS